MSTSIESIVDVECSLQEAPELAKRVVDKLCERGFILASPQMHELIGEGPRHATGPNAAQVAEPADCFPCGLDVKIGRRVVCPGERGLEILKCPFCDHAHAPEHLDWGSAVGEWYDNTGPGLLACGACGKEAVVATWRFEPVWGFGNLTFQFSEWRLKPEFVNQIAEQLGHRVAWVVAHW
jgi:hypothetical protein